MLFSGRLAFGRGGLIVNKTVPCRLCYGTEPDKQGRESDTPDLTKYSVSLTKLAECSSSCPKREAPGPKQ